jgi:anti-sigma factor RsiW
MFSGRHPEAQFVAYLKGELTERDHRRVAEHLAACPECARAVEDFQRILRDLTRSVPKPPEVHWGAYRSQLREKLDQRQAGSWGRQWLRWPIPVALSAAAAGALLILAVQSGIYRPGVPGDLASLEETVVAGRLDLLRQYSMLEHLDLLEDLDVVRQLDQLPRREG